MRFHTALAQLLLALPLVLTLGGCATTDPDPVQLAKEMNEQRFGSDEEQMEAADFLVDMADARMMDIAEGRVAMERGTEWDVREYGEYMVSEQRMLLDEIRTLAAAESVELPTDISDAKAEGLAELKAEEGEDLDETFVSMICIDHERDIERFREATTYTDPEVSDFAGEHLPDIEKHLRMAQALRDE